MRARILIRRSSYAIWTTSICCCCTSYFSFTTTTSRRTRFTRWIGVECWILKRSSSHTRFTICICCCSTCNHFRTSTTLCSTCLAYSKRMNVSILIETLGTCCTCNRARWCTRRILVTSTTRKSTTCTISCFWVQILPCLAWFTNSIGSFWTCRCFFLSRSRTTRWGTSLTTWSPSYSCILTISTRRTRCCRMSIWRLVCTCNTRSTLKKNRMKEVRRKHIW